MPLPLTYCNPLPLPNYQRGVTSRTNEKTSWYRARDRQGEQEDFREMADPSVIRLQGRWYMFPSRGMLWHSDDMVNWQFHPFPPFKTSDGKELPEIGYAPTVVQYGEWLLLTACWSGEMWRSKSPFGPWETLGKVRDENNQPFVWPDPMLFVDDDGALYCYFGLGSDGIYVARLKADQPNCFDGPRVHCFGFDRSHKWEWFGEHNQNPNISYIEGAHLLKRNGIYYLAYSAPATEHKNYGMGCYKGKSPLGPWEYQKRNPFLNHRGGLVNGCGHACIAEGPGDSLWCFYTTSVRIEHNFERRIGMDPVYLDENGDIYVDGPTETPQLAPGLVADHTAPGNRDVGLANLSAGCFVTASSTAPGRDPFYACDDIIRTWWEAAGPAPQWLQVDLQPQGPDFEVQAVRILFADRGLNYDAGAVPGPYRYTIEGSLDEKEWFTLLDLSQNDVDRHIDYQTFPPRKARYVRLNVLSIPPGLRLGIWEFTVFGRASV